MSTIAHTSDVTQDTGHTRNVRRKCTQKKTKTSVQPGPRRRSSQGGGHFGEWRRSVRRGTQRARGARPSCGHSPPLPDGVAKPNGALSPPLRSSASWECGRRTGARWGGLPRSLQRRALCLGSQSPRRQHCWLRRTRTEARGVVRRGN